MRKKEIEKIPYLTPPQAEEDFSMETDVTEIDGEKHLIIDVYAKDAQKAPVVRLAYTSRDWGRYFPMDGTWSRGSFRDFRDGYYCDKFIWGGDRKSTYISDESKSRILNFEGTWKSSGLSGWAYALGGLEENVKSARRRQTYENRRTKMEARLADTPPIPKEAVTWAKKMLRSCNFLYYKRKGNYADIHCSHCGGEYRARTKRPDTFEGQFMETIKAPKNNDRGQCALCGAVGTFKPIGHVESKKEISMVYFLGQKYHTTGAVVSCIKAIKTVSTYGAETFSEDEICRTYFEQGKRAKEDYFEDTDWNGEKFWTMEPRNKYIPDGEIYPGTYAELKGTILQYSGLKEYADHKGKVNAISYMKAYQETPYLEKLSKAGMYWLVENIMKGYIFSSWVDLQAKKPEDIFKVQPEHMKLLIAAQGKEDMWSILRREREMGCHWTEGQIDCLRRLHMGERETNAALQYMGTQQFLNRVEKYANRKFADHTLEADERLKHFARLYVDYLQMRASGGYDMTNTVYLFPKDLERAHTQMTAENNERNKAQSKMEKEEKYPEIKANYRKLRNIYFYEDDRFLIRPARSATEIVEEGWTLHHCVGQDSYLGRHNSGISYILMLRHKEDPETPYITVEILPNTYTIVQWYGAHDQKPDREIIQRWLDAYVTRLRCERNDGACRIQAAV